MPWTEAHTLCFAERTFRQEQGHLLALEFLGPHVSPGVQDRCPVMDGGYICRESKRAFFHKISDPSDQDIANLLESIIEAVELCLRKRGLLDEESEVPEDLQSAASRASVAQKIAFGERRGQRVRRVGFRREAEMKRKILIAYRSQGVTWHPVIITFASFLITNPHYVAQAKEQGRIRGPSLESSTTQTGGLPVMELDAL